MIRMTRKKSNYRIVPTTHEKFGACWALKEGKSVIGVFVTKDYAERRKLQLEKQTEEDFLIETTKNQELVIEA
jgi:hypothetical protein